MKLKIKDIGPSGRDVTWALGAEELRSLLRSADVECEAADTEAHVHLRFETLDSDLGAGEIVARGSLSARFAVPCGRCLGPAPVTLDDPEVAFTFTATTPEALDEVELALEDPSTYAFSGEEIDLASLLREALVLALPIAPVCQEGCRGICSGCGAELNSETCRCTDTPADTPWQAALKRIKQEKH